MARANQYWDPDESRFELFWSVLLMVILLGVLGLGTVRFLQALHGLAVSMPRAPFVEGTL